ncbi:GNAT family N-acetyltransferase [Frondihabitans australicus]|uniref:Acetyltransferase (GNAT) family protein n=1 Tax=Frondihabitans australicus TaxID=386892 RepID=A0A495IF01_9MICO|nr:GNAT family N-acetyltransferase [Frondihabitans australicus]RKR74567.1 acetyltransferase (GNAT) family protein [Frondihabitans australicus]
MTTEAAIGETPALGRGRPPGDLESCVGLWLAALETRDGHPPAPETADRCRDKFAQPVVSWRVLRASDDVVRGFGLVTAPGTGRPDDPADAAYLSLLAVDPDLQGGGLGSLLLGGLVDDTRAAGHRRVVLHVITDNTAAMRLYEARGWRPIGQPFAHPLYGRETVSLGLEL